MKRRNLSQPGPSSSNKSQRHSSTQPTIDKSFREICLAAADFNEMVNDCVRFLIYKSGHCSTFKKSDIQKYIKGAVNRNLQKIIERASLILEKVYGYKLILCDSGTKFYILSNILPYVEEDETSDNDSKKILLMLVLLHIFMSTNVVTEASMYSFLKSLKIDPDRNHKIFGNVKEYLMTTLPKQYYLKLEKDSITQNVTFAWGERAEKEISKHELLKFACKVSKSDKPSSWLSQFKEAEEQSLETHRYEQIQEEIDQSDL